jgi:glucose/arabinose dehydrogenase
MKALRWCFRIAVRTEGDAYPKYDAASPPSASSARESLSRYRNVWRSRSFCALLSAFAVRCVGIASAVSQTLALPHSRASLYAVNHRSAPVSSSKSSLFGSALLFAATALSSCTTPDPIFARRAGAGITIEAGAPDGGPVDTRDAGKPCDTCTSGNTFCKLPGQDTDLLDVPEGFCAREYYAPRIVESRVIRFAPNGDLFLAVPRNYTPGGASNGLGALVVLPDDNHDGIAEAPIRFAGSPASASTDCRALEAADANDLTCLHGLLFSNGYVYITRSDEVRRYRYSPGDRTAQGPSELVARLPSSGESRWTHTLDIGKDGTIYASVGRFESSGTCNEGQMSLGAVYALNVSAGQALPVTPQTVASGFRNPMYIRASERSGEVYAAELSGDGWGGIGGREKLALIEPGGRWGYPCCVAKGMPAVGSAGTICDTISEELLSIPLNDTPFGFDFERGTFPAPYTHGTFVALHGAFGQPWRGTSLAWMPVNAATGRPAGPLQTFAKGWSSKFPGRATDVAFAPDGRLFVIDDTQGRIFWIAPRTLVIP